MQSLKTEELNVNPMELARHGKVIVGEFELSKMNRLNAVWPQSTGQVVTYELKFAWLPQGKCCIKGKIHTSLHLLCQRCLKELIWVIDSNVSLMPMVDIKDWNQEDDAEGYDPIMIVDNRLNIYSLLEEEILLALPFYPKHNYCNISLEQIN